MLRKLVLFFSFLVPATYAYAAEVNSQRLMAVEKLFTKYSCAKFFFEADQTSCEWDRKILELDDSLNLDEKKWQRLFKDTELKLIERTTEDARIRNKKEPKLGMTKNYIYKHVLGAPDSINDTLDARGQTSQWVYRTEEGTMYLYFDNKNTLRTMQRSR